MPFVQSRNIVYGSASLTALLDALSNRPGGALLITPFVHLFTAGPAPITPDSTPADFTEATFDNYDPKALALPLLGPINADSAHLGVHNEVDFLGGDIAPPGQTILGYWVDEAATEGDNMYMGEVFETPIAIALPGDFISLDVDFSLPKAVSVNP